MHNKIKLILVGAAMLFTSLYSESAHALPAVSKQNTANDKEETTQAAVRVPKIYDVRKNTVSNIQFYTSNYGIFGLDVERNTGGGFWPRGSLNQYIFGGGIWFGALKDFKNPAGEVVRNKYAAVSYDPNQGASWLVPGRIEDKEGNEKLLEESDDLYLYRTYMSTEFNRTNGNPTDGSNSYSWPIWDTEDVKDGYHLGYDRYFGRFIIDPSNRTTSKYPKGPAYISEEDIFACFKDTDLSKYKMGPSAAKRKGYPLKLQFEQMIYSWGFGEYKDFVFIKYDIINMSNDSLRDCWMSPMMDVDIARAPYTANGSGNDRCKYYKSPGFELDPTSKDTLNLAFQWTMNNRGEDGKGFGYLGYDFLESPAVYKANGFEDEVVNGQTVRKAWMWRSQKNLLKGEINPHDGQPVKQDTVIGVDKMTYPIELEGFVRKDKRYYENKQQLGLMSFRNWNIEDDLKTDEEWYNFMSSIGDDGSYYRDGDKGPGDKRFMMATGPFSMMPKDTVRVVVGIILALPTIRREADGSEADVQNLVKRDMFAQKVYDNNFRAPAPPNNTIFKGYKSFNNAIEVHWDSTAEMSKDLEERGMDFMGYSLYRARDPYLDTFNVNTISGTNDYPKGRGPFGWKRIASWSIPTAFEKSSYRAGANDNSSIAPAIDDFEIVGMGFNKVTKDGNTTYVMDTMSVTVMRKPAGILTRNGNVMRSIDSLKYPYDTEVLWGFTNNESNPWTPYFKKSWNSKYQGLQIDPTKPYNTQFKNEFFIDSVMYGKLSLNQALITYNPLYWDSVTVAAIAVVKNKDLMPAKPKVPVKPAIPKKPADTNNTVLMEKYRQEMEEYPARLVKYNEELDQYNNVDYPAYLVALEPYNNPANYLRVAFTPADMDSTSFTDHLVNVTRGDKGGDTVHLYNTIRGIELNGTVKYYYTRMVPLWDKSRPATWEAIFKNRNWLDNTKAKLMQFIKLGMVDKISFGDVEGDTLAKKEVILPYMAKVTNGYKYYDYGDDNGTGVIDLNESSVTTEKILNNIDYYYKLEAYDEGDYLQPTEQKTNDGSVGRTNNTVAYAKTGRVDDNTEFEILHVDEDLLGGLKNFKFFGVDKERLKQKMEGRVLQLEFAPYTDISKYELADQDKELTKREISMSFYYRKMTITDTATKEVLFSAITPFDQTGAGMDNIMHAYSENGAAIVNSEDTVLNEFTKEPIQFGNRLNREKFIKTGSFTTGDFSVEYYPYSKNFTNGYDNMFGFSFDFAFEQGGGVMRPDTIYKQKSDATTMVTLFPISEKLNTDNYVESRFYAGTMYSDIVDAGYEYPDTKNKKYVPVKTRVASQYNLGPADYLIKFATGGQEPMTISHNHMGDTPKVTTFNVSYLTYDITNQYSIKAVLSDRKEHEVKYGFKYDFIAVPDTMLYDEFIPADKQTTDKEALNIVSYLSAFPHPINLRSDASKAMGKYTSFAVGYVNARYQTPGSNSKMRPTIAVDKGRNRGYNYSGVNLLGEQGKYYLTAISSTNDTLDFVNVVNIGGSLCIFDYARRGNIEGINADGWRSGKINPADKVFGSDFKVGDEVRFKVIGGVFGMPQNGAKVLARVKPAAVENNDYKESQLEKIKVVPNPFYITHEAQKSAYDTKLYFTKLPAKCTIDIYTVTGDLVRSINHEELGGSQLHDYKTAMDVWDLYSSNAQRVQSQTFVAVITTPNGEKSSVKFTVLVGSTRLIAD